MGKLRYILATTDVTHDKQIRENLNAAAAAVEHASASKSVFLSNMSHDMRTPMNAIAGMTKLTGIHIKDREKVKDCLYRIGIFSKHLLELINDVPDIPKIESGKPVLTSESFSPMGLIQRNITVVNSQYRAKDRAFVTGTEDVRHEYLLGDSLRSNQVLLNLFSNVGKFTPEDGAITLTVKELSQKHLGHAVYRTAVADTGIGINPEFLSKLFLSFGRERSRRRNQTKGTELGLVISEDIVAAMGGQIYVENRLGEGSVFTVEVGLPLSKEAGDELCGQTGPRDSRNTFTGRCPLLVKGNKLSYEIASQLLGISGAVVGCTPDGAEGAKVFEEKDPGYFDAIPMDIQMPVMNGYGVARRIRKFVHPQTGSIRIIAMSTSTFSDDVHATLKSGINARAGKPIDMGIFAGVLSAVL